MDERADHGRFTPDIYVHLRRLAGRMVDERGAREATLPATALVHEAWLKLEGHTSFDSDLHFLRTVAVAMRQVLIDHDRARQAEKRGGGLLRTTLAGLGDDRAVAVVELDRALQRLERFDADAAEVVLLRCFGGLSLDEVATAVGVSPRTVSTRWRHGRAWVLAHLAEPG